MAQNIKLNGGPFHGRFVAIEDHAQHFYTVHQMPELTKLSEPLPTEDSLVPTRRGRYSRVHNSPHDFEWDGYMPHD